MNKRVMTVIVGCAIAAVGFVGGRSMRGTTVTIMRTASAETAPALEATAVAAATATAAATASAATPTPKEPVASADEFKSHVIHHNDLPMTELVPGANSQLIVGEQSMISFLTMNKHTYFAPHRHKQEQIMIVLDGYCDEIIEGKLYRLKAGDVVILPSNIEHGAYMYDQDVHVIDVFGDVRADYLLKMMQVMAEQNLKLKAAEKK
jgi:quercetin dioxygenase-like cupin family protein